MRKCLLALAALGAVLGFSLTSAADEPDRISEPREERPPKYCTWQAVAGAGAGLGGLWFGYLAAYSAATGKPSSTAVRDDPGNVALVLTIEEVGLLGGATAGCAIWGHEQRWYPTADSVILGGSIGMAAGVGLALLVIPATGIDSDTDNPVASGFLALTLISVFTAAGGFGGYALDRAVRGPPWEKSKDKSLAIAPVLRRGYAGLRLGVQY